MKLFLLPLIACGFLVSCATNPVSRIKKNPEKFASLSESEKSLVQEGKIEEGMHKDGVFLALGEPDRIVSTLEDGDEYEDWSYFGLKPIYRQSFGVSIGSSYGHRFSRGFGGGFRGSGFHGSSFGFFGRRRGGFLLGSSVGYVPTLSALIRFEDDQVKGYKLRESN